MLDLAISYKFSEEVWKFGGLQTNYVYLNLTLKRTWDAWVLR
ncbi:MAG: hypothetical protein ACTS4U_00790 [Candidatus Hodgkinia cicadicola]